jgi:excisionase family DNA binding protein
MTMKEAAVVLGLGRTATYEAARRREIPVLKIGGRLVVSVPMLKELLGYSAASE